MKKARILPPNKKGRGQPPYQPTEADRTTVTVMVACGVKHEDIALCLGTAGIDDKTLRLHFRRELDIGIAKVNALCGQGIVRAMQAGEAWALCFWAKTRMGWREKSPLDDISEITVKRLVGVKVEDV